MVYETYNVKVLYNVLEENGDFSIYMNGEVWKSKINLIFSTGNKCKSKFNRKDIEGEILKISRTHVKILLDNSKTKRVDLKTFISDNLYWETLIRIENEDGKGPYTASRLKNKEYANWIQDNCGASINRPNPLDSGLYSLSMNNGKFAFRDEESMYSWFSKEEVQMLEGWGFSVKILQKGRNYCVSEGGYKQYIFFQNKEDHSAFLKGRRSGYYEY